MSGRSNWLIGGVAVGLSLASVPWARGIEPADPDLIPEGRRLLDYLHAVQGQGILTGVSRVGGGPEPVLHGTGREPAIRHLQSAFFLVPNLAVPTVETARQWWHEKGGVVQFHFHWPNFMRARTRDASPSEKSADLEKVLTPGTDEYKTFHKELGVVADHLEQLAQAKVPVLWTAFHEIDGGWFWWTDVEKPENTAALWRQMFKYLVTERKIHNLIWVYQPAHSCNLIQGQRTAKRGGRKSPGVNRLVSDEELQEEIAFRRRYYPGDQYVDIASISTYGNQQLGWGAPWEDARQKAYELLAQIAPGPAKAGMLACGESPALVNPITAQLNGPPWLWCLTWYAPGGSRRGPNPVGWARYTFNHDVFITLDRLPLLKEGNVMPNVRLTHPVEGAEGQGRQLHILGVATDRNNNLKTVTVHALTGPWLDWIQRKDFETVRAAFGDATRLGEAELQPNGQWSFTWQDPPAGYHNLIAFARDADGAEVYSNAARITTGLQNLARGKKATASSVSPHGGPPEDAVDGDPFSMWWSDNSQDDPQWLMVDLGAEKRVGAVGVSWWKAHATHYTVQASSDGEEWREVVRIEGRRAPQGDSDLIRFDPVPARYLRLHCTKRAVTWQAFCVGEFAAYERLPSRD